MTVQSKHNALYGVFIYYLPVDSSSAIRSVRINWEQSRMIVTALLSCLIVSVLLIIIGFFMRKSRKRSVSRILAITGWFYSEIKLIMGFIALVCLISVVDEIGWIDFFPARIRYSVCAPFHPKRRCLWSLPSPPPRRPMGRIFFGLPGS